MSRDRSRTRGLRQCASGSLASRRGGAIWSSIAIGLGEIPGCCYREQLDTGHCAVTVGIMRVKRAKEQSGADRFGRRPGLLSLLCVLLLVLTAGLFGPATASDPLEPPPISTHLVDSEHCPPADDGHGIAPSCASAAGCAAFLLSADVRPLHGVSLSGGLPSLTVRPLGQFLPPLIQPPEHLFRL